MEEALHTYEDETDFSALHFYKAALSEDPFLGAMPSQISLEYLYIIHVI
jgi:hypothetical protein